MHSVLRDSPFSEQMNDYGRAVAGRSRISSQPGNMRIYVQGMSASAYAKLVPRANRGRKLPKIDRPMRPRMIAWAGPDAFYPNRFYEIDRWYKARIDKPEKVPQLHIIEPSKYNYTLEQLMKKDDTERVNIGFARRPVAAAPAKSVEERAALEKQARNRQLMIDLDSLDHSNLAICDHYKVFDHLFGEGVYFENTQHLDVAYGDHAAYLGNVISTGDTVSAPSVEIESVGAGGMNTLVMLNLDGNPFEKTGQLAHWIVSNIPDGGGVSAGEEVVPYLQPLPFSGSGHHRVAFLLFRHDKPIDKAAWRVSSALSSRVLDMAVLYKSLEAQLTPSAIAFHQCEYDDSVKHALHNIGEKSPVFEYEWNEARKPEQKEFPHKPQPFNHYLDMYRDPKAVEEEMLTERLEKAQLGELKASKWLDVDYNENKKKLPAWQHEKMMARQGRASALYNNALKQ